MTCICQSTRHETRSIAYVALSAVKVLGFSFHQMRLLRTVDPTASTVLPILPEEVLPERTWPVGQALGSSIGTCHPFQSVEAADLRQQVFGALEIIVVIAILGGLFLLQARTRAGSLVLYATIGLLLLMLMAAMNVIRSLVGVVVALGFICVILLWRVIRSKQIGLRFQT